MPTEMWIGALIIAWGVGWASCLVWHYGWGRGEEWRNR